MLTRHSKQIPIPHKGARGSPATEVRVVAPAIITAAATVVPGLTAMGAPFTVSVSERVVSGMGFLRRRRDRSTFAGAAFEESRGQIRFRGDLRFLAEHTSHKKFCRSQ